MLIAAVLPMITDSDEQLDRLLGKVAAAGAGGATVLALHLRPGAQEWFWAYLARHHPGLVDAPTPSSTPVAPTCCARMPPTSLGGCVRCSVDTGWTAQRSDETVPGGPLPPRPGDPTLF